MKLDAALVVAFVFTTKCYRAFFLLFFFSSSDSKFDLLPLHFLWVRASLHFCFVFKIDVKIYLHSLYILRHRYSWIRRYRLLSKWTLCFCAAVYVHQVMSWSLLYTAVQLLSFLQSKTCSRLYLSVIFTRIGIFWSTCGQLNRYH